MTDVYRISSATLTDTGAVRIGFLRLEGYEAIASALDGCAVFRVDLEPQNLALVRAAGYDLVAFVVDDRGHGEHFAMRTQPL